MTAEEKNARAEEIAKALSDNKTWFSHGRALGIAKLKQLRLEIDDYSGDDKLRSGIRSYNDLLTAYADRNSINFLVHSHLTTTI